MESTLAIQEELQSLNFHDSALGTVSIKFSSGNARSCSLLIDYYDWEGNSKRRQLQPAAQWAWKRLKITFGYLAHIEFNAPDLVNRAQDIDSLELGYGIEARVLPRSHGHFR